MAYEDLISGDIDPNKPVKYLTFGLRTYENFRAISAYGSVAPLGGSPTTAVVASGWTRVPGYLPARMNQPLASGWTRQAVILTRTLVSGESVQWRVRDGDGTVVVTGTAHTNMEWTEEIVTIAPAAADKRHYLEVQSGNANMAVQGYGVIEQFKE